MNGARTVVRFLDATNVKIQSSVAGEDFTSSVAHSEDIVRIGSIKYSLERDQYLYLNLIMLNGTYDI